MRLGWVWGCVFCSLSSQHVTGTNGGITISGLWYSYGIVLLSQNCPWFQWENVMTLYATGTLFPYSLLYIYVVQQQQQTHTLSWFRIGKYSDVITSGQCSYLRSWHRRGPKWHPIPFIVLYIWPGPWHPIPFIVHCFWKELGCQLGH